MVAECVRHIADEVQWYLCRVLLHKFDGYDVGLGGIGVADKAMMLGPEGLSMRRRGACVARPHSVVVGAMLRREGPPQIVSADIRDMRSTELVFQYAGWDAAGCESCRSWRGRATHGSSRRHGASQIAWGGGFGRVAKWAVLAWNLVFAEVCKSEASAGTQTRCCQCTHLQRIAKVEPGTCYKVLGARASS